ncbi:hypothetical protein F5X96DRAFT_655716 [Biscogniauxia mediterranea]|nr:hypothetical protein F5X96DRAFT_655716 [Biscogniauxia mediterranea]
MRLPLVGRVRRTTAFPRLKKFSYAKGLGSFFSFSYSPLIYLGVGQHRERNRRPDDPLSGGVTLGSVPSRAQTYTIPYIYTCTYIHTYYICVHPYTYTHTHTKAYIPTHM